VSWTEASDPACSSSDAAAVEKIIDARPRKIDGFTVGRVLPAAARRQVGPFVFFDHMGPATLAPGHGMDVRPHPHINLATITYLYEGEVVHRDSLGSEQTIRPGAVNWMTAGRGIAHSERTPPEARRAGSRLHGLQLWVALPRAHEEIEPEFDHYPAGALPAVDAGGGVRARVLAGTAFGVTSPVRTRSPLVYLEAELSPGARLEIPPAPERAAYVVAGALVCGDERAAAGRMLVFARGSAVVRAEVATRLVVIGGEPLDGPRHIWWNFVSSSKERIEQAKRDWREGRFPKIPGDDREFIPLP
jgi:redox-sensitive bicupin YhaK (pirin superfamily)